MSKKDKDSEVCPDCGRVHLSNEQLQEQINLADDFVGYMILPAIDGYEDRMALPPALIDSIVLFEIASRLIRAGQPIDGLIENIHRAADRVAAEMDQETPHAAPERSQ